MIKKCYVDVKRVVHMKFAVSFILKALVVEGSVPTKFLFQWQLLYCFC